MYDITSRDSFNNVMKWLDETKNYANDKVTVMLVGNKTDLDAKYLLKSNEGESSASKRVTNWPKRPASTSWKHRPKIARI